MTKAWAVGDLARYGTATGEVIKVKIIDVRTERVCEGVTRPAYTVEVTSRRSPVWPRGHQRTVSGTWLSERKNKR